MISFNVPPFHKDAIKYIQKAVENHMICGDGEFVGKCHKWFEEKTGAAKVLMTTSCTHATEMAAILCGFGPGDEVIMPSFTYPSTADAFVLRGSTPVMIDIRPDTMNIDENLVEDAITDKTKAIVPVHYAGVSCAMDKILEIAKKYNLYVIEDAAQGMMSYYKGQALGTMGDFGCYSFHETKNYSMGCGGALLMKDIKWLSQSEIVWDVGTNRGDFQRGTVDKYMWVDKGSSYFPSDLNCAYLYAQLEHADDFNNWRLGVYNQYKEELTELEKSGDLTLPHVPEECKHNGHMFYIRCKDIEERSKLIKHLKKREITAVFHYIPLHSAPAGKKYTRFHGNDVYTTKESERLLRLPLWYGLKVEQVSEVCDAIKEFYK